MTFHIIIVFNTGSRLSCERGFLVCQYPDGDENRIALADVRSIVIANPAVSFTYEVSREEIVKALGKTKANSRKKGMLAITEFKRLGALRWQRAEQAS